VFGRGGEVECERIDFVVMVMMTRREIEFSLISGGKVVCCGSRGRRTGDSRESRLIEGVE